MEEFIKDAKDASHEDEILSAYDKEWETRLWGYEEGSLNGHEEGRKEKETEIVRNMLKEKMDISLIKKVTELSEKEILEIKEKAE